MSELTPGGQSPAAPVVAPAVQPSEAAPIEPKAVHAYRSLQSENDTLKHNLSTLEEYEKEYPRLKNQLEKQSRTIAQLEADKKVSKLVAENPHLAKLASLQDFSGKTDEEINQWGQAATEALNTVAGSTMTPTAPTGPNAPKVQPLSATASDGQMITPEALKSMPLDQQRAYLIANGIIKG